MTINDSNYSSEEEDQTVNEQFYERANAFIDLANEQADSESFDAVLPPVSPGEVSASFMYANSRYSAWLSACAYQNVEDFKHDRETIREYYLEQFKMMLDDHLDDYTENFATYFPPDEQQEIQPENELKRFV